jgi:UDP-galactopyranose mutase
MLGPVAKIDPSSLPVRPNIHYLGMKSYDQLPAYISGWNAAMMPFARNAATRFISPTKTPEYLAAGRPVVSTSIPDVVASYGAKRLAHIADSPGEFVTALGAALRTRLIPFQRRVDRFLDSQSWDKSVETIERLIDKLERHTADLEHGHLPAAAAR